MNIYDLKLHGIFRLWLNGSCEIELSKEKEQFEGKTSDGGFGLSVLEFYEGREDVLCIEHLNGIREFITLCEPREFLKAGEWKAAENETVVYEFFKILIALNQNTDFDISNLKFHGILENSIGRRLRANVSLSEKVIAEIVPLFEAVRFVAVVLPEYEGKKYVIAGVTEEEDNICHIPLFEPDMYYDDEKHEWAYCNESSIPDKILNSYLKLFIE